MTTQAKTSVKGLPKFDTAGWLSTGVLFSLVLVADNIWSLAAGWNSSFFPSKFGEILGIAVGLGLGIHCVDMIVYHRRHRSFGKMD
jgi:hypothetical protein